MVRVQIEGEERSFEQLDDNWITSQIVNRRKEGLEVCVRVYIDSGNICMVLSTPGCHSSAEGKSRPYSECEMPLSDLWEELGLRRPDYSPRAVLRFLKRIAEYSR